LNTPKRKFCGRIIINFFLHKNFERVINEICFTDIKDIECDIWEIYVRIMIIVQNISVFNNI
jgi:hypothetical protein